ncbi:MAG: ECF RNA polymerase sigma factor SigL [Parabacteroides sp.]
MEDMVSLVERVRTGDREAFNELYNLYYPVLRSYAGLLLKEEEEAEDVVQDVFLNVWLRKEILDDTLSLRGYLLRSVYNTALNIIKRRGYSETYRSVYEKEVEEIGFKYYDPDACDIIRKLYDRDIRSDINMAIKSLPDRCREVFSLSYLHDMPSKEISRKLGISLRTVESHIYSALKLLREKLEHYKPALFLLFLL